MFFSSFFKRKHVHTFVHTAGSTVAFVGPASFVFNATCPLSFQLFQQKRWSRGRLQLTVFLRLLVKDQSVQQFSPISMIGSSLKQDNLSTQSLSTQAAIFFICLLLALASSIVKASLPEVNKFTGNCFRVVRIILKMTFLKLKGLVHDNSHV